MKEKKKRKIQYNRKQLRESQKSETCLSAFFLFGFLSNRESLWAPPPQSPVANWPGVCVCVCV